MTKGRGGGVDEGDRAPQTQVERVDGGDGEKCQLHAVAPVEHDAAVGRHVSPRRRHCRQAMKTTMLQPTPISSRLAPVMLASASEQGDSLPLPIGRAFTPELLERVAALDGEDQVDRVLGQDGDEGQHRDGQAGRDVELGDLGGPGEEEGGADDRQSEEGGFERIGQMGLGEPQVDARYAGSRRGRGRECVAAAGECGRCPCVPRLSRAASYAAAQAPGPLPDTHCSREFAP